MGWWFGAEIILPVDYVLSLLSILCFRHCFEGDDELMKLSVVEGTFWKSVATTIEFIHASFIGREETILNRKYLQLFRAQLFQ
mmetsp:Transcript_16140/g.34069  ORF Transcript_16140/g.34069 Transcript_16140/m.34069 type:complete len:83 (+) Transcript_16140:528-776(+)